MSGETRAAGSWWWRWRWWLLAAGVLVILLRVALPEIVRRVLVAQVAALLHTRVEIGDVDLALLRGGVALEDVAVYAPTPESPAEPPLVAWRTLAVAVRYLPLFGKTVRLRELVLDAPHVALDRLADGELNLRKLVPAGEPESPDAAPATEPSAWKVGVDRFVLRAGGIRFRDLTLAEGEPLEIAIPDIAVEEVALQPEVYGKPGRVRVLVKTEGGSARADAQLHLLSKGFALDARLKVLGLPLRRARFYVPGVGWSELAGKLDAALDYGLEADRRNEVRGLLRLRDVSIKMPDLEQAAFAVKRFAVRVDPIDLLGRRAVVPAVEVNGASVIVDLQGGEPLPLLRRRSEAAPVEPTSDAAAPTAAPWHWRLGSLRLTDSSVSLWQDAAPPLDVGVTVTVRDLADPSETPGRLEATVGVAPGSAVVAAALRVSPPGFGGTVRIDALPVQDLVRAARAAAALPPGLLQAAALGADLVVEAGLAAQGGAPSTDALRVKGSIGLDGVQLAGQDPKAFALGWRRLVVPISDLQLPGVLPGASAVSKQAPIRVALGDVRLDEPALQLTRTAEGIVLPASGGAPPAPPPADARTPEPSPPASPRPVDVSVASFILDKGRVAFADRTVKPFFAAEVKPLDVEARGIRSDGPAVTRFTVSAATPKQGKIDVVGSLTPGGGTIEVNGKEVALMPYNPYVTAFSPYSLGGGRLTVRTKASFAKGAYDTTTAITLHQLGVKGAEGDSLFKQQFGIPLTMVLALMRDLNGDIKLDVPVTVDQSGTTVALGTVVAGALKSALVGALTSPLKLVGAVAGIGGSGGSVEPAPLPALLGRPDLAPQAAEQIGQLAALLASRPGLTVQLEGIVTSADVRWLREQDLRVRLDERRGVLSAIRGLPERQARQRIQAALAARAEGKPGDLGAEDSALLEEWLADVPAADAQRAGRLATDRARRVASVLESEHGIPAARVSVATPSGEPAAAAEAGPAVRFDLGASP